MIRSRQATLEAGNARPATATKRVVRFVGITAAVLGFGATFACSSSKSNSPAVDAGTPCNENPWECPSGQVCWPTTNSAFACLPSGTAQAGETCMLTLAAATCSDGLNCLATGNASAGVCSPYCDPTGTTHTCAATDVCASAFLPGGGSGADFNVCTPAEEGGATGEAGPSETDASDASVSVSDASASDASADVVVGE